MRTSKPLYVWEIPVRATHWLVALAIVALTVTGLAIGEPWLFGARGTMAGMKATHLVFAVVLLCAVVWRIAWAFMGNGWARWSAFVPFATPGWWARARDTFLFYIFVRRRSPEEAGHNPLAALAYLFVYALLALEIFTGFALAAMSWGGWWGNAFGWIFLAVPANDVRLTHHMVMWLLLGFVVHHVYSSVLMDSEERSGLLSSIVTGYKLVRWKR